MEASAPPFPLSLLIVSLEGFFSMGILVPGKHSQCNVPGTHVNLLLSCQCNAKKVKLCAETQGVESSCHTGVFQRKARESRRNGELVERGTCSIVFMYLTLFFFLL